MNVQKIKLYNYLPASLPKSATLTAPDGFKFNVYPDGDNLWLDLRELAPAIAGGKISPESFNKLKMIAAETGTPIAQRKLSPSVYRGTFIHIVCEFRGVSKFLRAVAGRRVNILATPTLEKIIKLADFFQGLKDFDQYFVAPEKLARPDELTIIETELAVFKICTESTPSGNKLVLYYDANGKKFIAVRHLTRELLWNSGGGTVFHSNKGKNYGTKLGWELVTNGLPLYKCTSALKSNYFIAAEDIPILLEDALTSEALEPRYSNQSSSSVYQRTENFFKWWTDVMPKYLAAPAPETATLPEPKPAAPTEPETADLPNYIYDNTIGKHVCFRVQGKPFATINVYRDNANNFYVSLNAIRINCGFSQGGGVSPKACVNERLLQLIVRNQVKIFIKNDIDSTFRRGIALIDFECVSDVVREFIESTPGNNKHAAKREKAIKFLEWWKRKVYPPIKKHQQERAAFEKNFFGDDTGASEDNEKEGNIPMTENTGEIITIEDLKQIADTVRKLQGAHLPKDLAIRTAINLRANEVGKDLSVINEFFEAVSN